MATICRINLKNVNITFSKLIKRYKSFSHFQYLSAKTKENIEATLTNHIGPYFGDTLVKKLSPTDINDFLISLSSKNKMTDGNGTLSPTTQYHIWLLLQRLLDYAKKNHYLQVNPCAWVNQSLIPKPNYATANTLTATNLTCLLDEMFDQDQNLVMSKVKNSLITWLIISTGLRCHDIYKLTWKDVDWNNKTINGMEADDVAMLILKQHQNYQNNWLKAHPSTMNAGGWIFISYRNYSNLAHNPKPNSYYQWLKRFSKRINLGHINVRSLQRTGDFYELEVNSNNKCNYNLLGCLGPAYSIV